MLWHVLLGIAATLILYYLRWRNRELRKIHKMLPTSLSSLPIVGHLLHLMGNTKELMVLSDEVAKDSYKTDGITSCWILNKFFVIITDPEPLEVILKNCLEKDDIMNVAKPLLGTGSVFAPVPIWRTRRKLITPTFNQKNLNNYVNIFSKQSEILMEKLKENCGMGKFSIYKNFYTYALDSICETTLGTEVHSQSNTNDSTFLAFQGFCNISAYRIVRPWLHNNTINKLMPYYSKYIGYVNTLINYVDKIITTKKQENAERQNIPHDQSNGSKIKSFVELIIQSGGEGISDLAIREESLAMLLAGSDTSANTASFFAVLMAQHPKVQEKAYQEIREVLGNSNRSITVEDLPKLKYLEAVIKETLRLYPPIPFLVRKVEKNVTLPSGITLTPGVGVIVLLLGLQRNPKYWGSDAEYFRPERFIDNPPSHPNAFATFGHGIRNCPGSQYSMMSMKTVLATLLRQYRVLPVNIEISNKNPTADGIHRPILENKCEPLKTKFEIILRHVDNYEVELEIRK